MMMAIIEDMYEIRPYTGTKIIRNINAAVMQSSGLKVTHKHHIRHCKATEEEGE